MPSCDPADLSVLAKPFANLNPRELEAIKTYLLAVRAGGSTDPSVLMDDAKCFMCMKDNQLKAIQTQLLCTISGGGTGDCAALAGDAPPTGLVTPEFVGQLYNRNSGESFWYSTGLTNADWVQIVTPCGGFIWGPNTTTISGFTADFSLVQISYPANDVETISFPTLVTISTNFQAFSMNSLTSVDMALLQTVGGLIDLHNDTALATLNMPSLVSVTGGKLDVSASALTSISFPMLQTISSHFEGTSQPQLTSVSLPALTTIGGDWDFFSCANLTTISVPLWTPTNGKNVELFGDALTQATVDHILARCVANAGYVSGDVDVSGGTSSAPSAAGLASKATLVGRGCTVENN